MLISDIRGNDMFRRSRSQTPGRISLVKALTRLNWKLSHTQLNNEETSLEKLEEKQQRAEANRTKRGIIKNDFIQREKEKFIEIKEKNAEKLKLQKSEISKKLEEAEEVNYLIGVVC